MLAVIPPPQAGELGVGEVQRFEQVAALGRYEGCRVLGLGFGVSLGWLSGMHAQIAGATCTLKLLSEQGSWLLPGEKCEALECQAGAYLHVLQNLQSSREISVTGISL